MGSHYNNKPAGSLFGPPIHDVNRFSAPPSLRSATPPPPPPPSYHHDTHNHSHGHHDNDHQHHDLHDHDHEHGHHDDHDDHHDHDHHHNHDDHHDHDHTHGHHDHDDHHDHPHHDHDDHHDHDHGHHDHSHSHSNKAPHQPHVFQPASNDYGVSQRSSGPAMSPSATFDTYPFLIPHSSGSSLPHSATSNMGGSADLLQPSSLGYVFTAPKSDGWVHEGESWNHNYKQEQEVKTKASLSQYMKIIWIDKDAKNLFMFIILSTSFTIIEIMYGTMSNSLGLISEAFHTIFDIIAMVISLIALVLSRHEPNNKFSYGYDRIEILSGFANGAFLLFVSFFLFVESVERILEPPELHSHGRVISVAFVGLIINAIGIMFFSRHSLHRSEHRSKARQDNMKIIMTHLFTDMLSGIGVIISSWLVQLKGWHFADTFISILIAVMIVRNAWPICSRMARVLLQTTPDSIYPAINKCLREAGTLEGVLEYHSEHFWTQSPGVFVGSLSVKVRTDANEQAVLQQVTKLFLPYIRHLTVQIEKDNWNL